MSYIYRCLSCLELWPNDRKDCFKCGHYSKLKYEILACSKCNKEHEVPFNVINYICECGTFVKGKAIELKDSLELLEEHIAKQKSDSLKLWHCCGQTYNLKFYKNCEKCGKYYLDNEQPTKTLTQEAEELINGPRRQSYGPIEESSRRLAEAWSSLLSSKLKESITPEETMLMMVMLKLLRETQEHKRDNLVDAVGYILLAEKVHEA